MDLYANLHAEEVEAALLGATIIHPHDDVLEAFLSVPVSAYWSERHRVIAEAIRSLNDLEIETDLVNLTDHLRRSGKLEAIGSAAFLIGVAEAGSTSGAYDYAQRLLELYRRRKLVDFAGESIKLARNLGLSMTEIKGRIEQSLTAAEVAGEEHRGIDLYAETAIGAISGGKTKGWFRSGIEELDRVTGDMKGLVVIGARPSMGKSSLARDILRNQVKAGRKVALFTQDQYGSDVMAFEASLRSRIEYGLVKSSDARPDQKERWRRAVHTVRDEYRDTFLIDDRPHNIFELATRIRAAARWGAELIAIDYLQLIEVPGTRGDSTLSSVTQISKTLKHLTQELELPIIALAQLSRAVENRNPPRPMLSDLRESGQIEQDAEVVIFLYREEYYRARSEGRSEDPESWGELVISKNKTGATGTARIPFTSTFATFQTLSMI